MVIGPSSPGVYVRTPDPYIAFHSMALKWWVDPKYLATGNDPPSTVAWLKSEETPGRNLTNGYPHLTNGHPGDDPNYSNKSWDDPPSGVVGQICSGATGEVFL